LDNFEWAYGYTHYWASTSSLSTG